MKIPFFRAEHPDEKNLGDNPASEVQSQPMKVYFEALPITQDRLGKVYGRVQHPPLNCYIEVSEQQVKHLFELDDKLVLSLYTAKASIPDRFTIFDSEGTPLAQDAVLRTAGRQHLNFHVGDQEYMASFDLAAELSERSPNRYKPMKTKTGMGM